MIKILENAVLAIGSIGITVVIYGVFIAFIKIIILEFKRLKGKNICKGREELRHHLGSYILLGLEFFITADIIETVARPGLKELTVLGSIVAIRTVLSFFITRELEKYHNCQKETR